MQEQELLLLLEPSSASSRRRLARWRFFVLCFARDVGDNPSGVGMCLWRSLVALGFSCFRLKPCSVMMRRSFLFRSAAVMAFPSILGNSRSACACACACVIFGCSGATQPAFAWSIVVTVTVA